MAAGVLIPPTVEAVARKMYQAYNDQGPNPWKTFDGRSVPTWDEINDQVRGKWIAAAVEARKLWDPVGELYRTGQLKPSQSGGAGPAPTPADPER